MSQSPRISSADLKTTEVTVRMPMSYQHFNAGTGKPLLLFLHGYTDTGAGFLKRALPDLDPAYEILSPNGLFPVPQKIDHGWRQAFSWYFAEFLKNSVLISPQVAATALVQLLQELKLEDREKIVLGFSQGGFFIPHVLPHLKNVKRMIGIGAGYRIENYPQTLSAPLDAIHGTADEVVPFDQAKESFQALKSRNPLGTFYAVEGLTHTMNQPAREILKQKISETF